ncbi:hypothetical protein [Nocardia australiensis]|nr:hypothetical protein [Nocardia australiensis]
MTPARDAYDPATTPPATVGPLRAAISLRRCGELCPELREPDSEYGV